MTAPRWLRYACNPKKSPLKPIRERLLEFDDARASARPRNSFRFGRENPVQTNNKVYASPPPPPLCVRIVGIIL